MAKKSPPRVRLKALSLYLTPLTNQNAPTLETIRLKRRIAKKLLRPLEKAFETAGLNIEDEADWEQLLLWLAWAMYGGKEAGAPKKWNSKKLRRLLEAVRELRSGDPNMKETRCCNLLSRGQGGQGRYKGQNANTLRRVLQKAKALDEQARLLATPVRDILGSEAAGGAKRPKTN